jgi:hypothetical protein
VVHTTAANVSFRHSNIAVYGSESSTEMTAVLLLVVEQLTRAVEKEMGKALVKEQEKRRKATEVEQAAFLAKQRQLFHRKGREKKRQLEVPLFDKIVRVRRHR